MSKATEGAMESWEKATMTIPPKPPDYGQIGRGVNTGFNLVDLRTDSLLYLLRRVVENPKQLIEAKKLLEDYKNYEEHCKELIK